MLASCGLSDPHRFRNVKDAADVERGVGAVVERVARLVVGLGHVAIELLVLPVADLFRLHHPQGLKEKKMHFLFFILTETTCVVG